MPSRINDAEHDRLRPQGGRGARNGLPLRRLLQRVRQVVQPDRQRKGQVDQHQPRQRQRDRMHRVRRVDRRKPRKQPPRRSRQQQQPDQRQDQQRQAHPRDTVGLETRHRRGVERLRRQCAQDAHAKQQQPEEHQPGIKQEQKSIREHLEGAFIFNIALDAATVAQVGEPQNQEDRQEQNDGRDDIHPKESSRSLG
ncbi:MAG: hypothetical protein MUE63_15920, partial [Xanthomonadales bacterium]|nr:hypothetical protein [Xanthomonadales bacterium]